MTPPRALDEIIAYFDQKTSAIIDRYGPGPRIHYHTGLMDLPPGERATAADLRRALVDSQTLMLRAAADIWDAPRRLSGSVLDVGCGLGGGSIFWAEAYGARVTALTCVASHVPYVQRFAAEAGVADKVRTIVGDACEFSGNESFDAVVAVDASGYLLRDVWFARVASLLRPGGSAFVIDCFLEDAKLAPLFDQHWRTRIGALDEYLDAAASSGLQLSQAVDVSARTVHFWTTTLALLDLEAERTAKASASRRTHELVREGLSSGGFRYKVLSFEKRSP